MPAARGETPSFELDIVPALSKHGCNSGGCHGALAGKVSGAGGGGFMMIAVDAEHRYAVVRALEQSLPVSTEVTGFLEREHPDLLMVTPLLYFGSQQGEYVRAAARLGIRSVLCVGSWDHLTTKGLIHVTPDQLVHLARIGAAAVQQQPQAAPQQSAPRLVCRREVCHAGLGVLRHHRKIGRAHV